MEKKKGKSGEYILTRNCFAIFDFLFFHSIPAILVKVSTGSSHLELLRKLLTFHDIPWEVYLKLLKIMQFWANIKRVYTSHTHLKSKEDLYASKRITLLSSGNDFSSYSQQ